MSEQSLAIRDTVSEIVAQRNLAIRQYGDAHAAMVMARDLRYEAGRTGTFAHGRINCYNSSTRDERKDFLGTIVVPERDVFMAEATRLTDIDAWARVIEITDLERLMDKKAKDQFRSELINDPPEVTEANILATIEKMASESATIFRRGIAECFSTLDRRFRSHDGWKIGSRIILPNAFNDNGDWSYYSNLRDTLFDIERTFCVLDGRPVPSPNGGIVAAIDKSRANRGWATTQSYVETDFFRARGFHNGNLHLYFCRDDLVERANKLIGEYYGNPIPQDRAPDMDTGLHRAKTTPAKNFGFYPTPDTAADIMFGNVTLWRGRGDNKLRVLEPSAGTGQLARRAVAGEALVDCVEIQPDLARQLRGSGLYERVTCANFLDLTPDPNRLYHRVIMNPPFDHLRDVDHVVHALKFLAPGGILTAIMSASVEFSSTKKAVAFRKLVEQRGGTIRDMPPNSFSEVGTNVNTILVTIPNKAH